MKYLDNRRTSIGIALGIVVLALLPFVLSRSLLYFVTTLLVLFIFAVSYDVLYGYTGLLSLMHASFYGLGAAVFYHVIGSTGSTLVGIAVALIAAAIFGVVIGLIATRITGVGFIIVTLVFNIIFLRIVQTVPVFIGGSDGVLLDVPAINLFVSEISLFSTANRYYLAAVCAAISIPFMFYVAKRAPVGIVATGIRENEDRMRAIGYDVGRLKVGIFAFSGVFAGLAGVLSAIQLAYVSASNFDLILSFDALTYVLLGGTGTLYGAVLGVLAFYGLEYFVSPYFEFYLVIPAFLLVLVVLFFPRGLYGALESVSDYVDRSDLFDRR